MLKAKTFRFPFSKGSRRSLLWLSGKELQPETADQTMAASKNVNVALVTIGPAGLGEYRIVRPHSHLDESNDIPIS